MAGQPKPGQLDPSLLTSTEHSGTNHAGIDGVGETNPDVVPQAEAEAGTATTERTWTAQRVKQAIDALAPGGAVDVQEFTSSGTWTKPSSGTLVMILAWGAGGGGAIQGGGGGGACVQRWMKLSDISGNQTVTIGAGSTGLGGSTTFGSHVTAYGGNSCGSSYGGGGGGSLSAGASGGTSGRGGLPGVTIPATTYPDNHGFGGGAGAGISSLPGTSHWGGGGGGFSTGGFSTGGSSVYGGGGGGQAGGTSLYGGDGGSLGNAGTQPGGGGGRTSGGSTLGAAGKVVVYVFP